MTENDGHVAAETGDEERAAEAGEDERAAEAGEDERAAETGDGERAAEAGEDESTEAKLDRAWRRVEGTWERFTGSIAASGVGRWFKSVERPGIVDWALLIAICALAFVTFLYGDIKATFEHSFNFLDSVFQGRPQDFYQMAIDNNTYGHPAVYDVPIYAVFGLWNLPTYLFYKFGDYDYLDWLPALLWLKTMLVVFSLTATWLVTKIARELGVSRNRAKWVAFYFLSSMTLFVPVLIVVQYDIISITFMLAGVLAYMRGKTRSFLLWFLLANTFKLFAVFIFIPLVLLREKRLPRALAQLVVGMLGVLACRLLYGGDLGYQISTGGFTEGMLQRLGASGFQWIGGNLVVSIFIVFMVGLAIFAYVKRPATDRETMAYAIYLPLAAFLVFCAFVPLNPYWAALVAPFAVLIIFANPRHLTMNSLLEVGIGSAIFVTYLMVGYSMYNTAVMSGLPFGQTVDPASPQRFTTPRDLLVELGLEDKLVYLVGFMVACVIAVLILNFPRAEFVRGMPNTEPIKRSIIWMRLAAPLCFCAILFAMYLVPAQPVVYSTSTGTPTQTVDLSSPAAFVEEQLEFDDTLAVDVVQVGFNADTVTWLNLSTIDLSITDSDGETVFEGQLATNAIKSGLNSFETDGLVLEAGEQYTLRLEADGGREHELIFVQVNPDIDTFESIQNGFPVVGDLLMVLNGTVKE